MPDELLIKNTRLYSSLQIDNRFDIHLRDGKIFSITPSGYYSSTCPVIDGSGYLAIPGLIDLHMHGAGGADSLDAKKESFITISQTLARLGTTSFLSAMVVRPGEDNPHIRVASEFTGKNEYGAELAGIYLEGPFINIKKRGGILPECITDPSLKVLDDLLSDSGNSLKIMCVAPEVKGNEKIIKRLRDKNIISSFGHSDAGYDETKRGLDAGINHVTHLFNAMPSLHHRNPGPIAAILESNNVTVEIIADSHHVHPGIIAMVTRIMDMRNIVCITDGISGMGLPDGQYTYNNKPYTSENGLATFMDGTFIGSTMSLLQVFTNFMKYTRTELNRAIDSVTINPARILGLEDRKGSIEPGKDADIVLVDKSLEVQYTFVGGKIVYNNKSE